MTEHWANSTDLERGWGMVEENGKQQTVIYIGADLANAIRKPDWWNKAACRNPDLYRGEPEIGLEPIKPADIFFPEPTSNGGNHLAPARRICKECPVRYKCLESGIDEQFGIWGGHSPSQRRKITSLVKKGCTLEEASRRIDARSRDAR